MSSLTERSPLVDMSRPSQEKTTPRSSGSYQRIKSASKGITIEENHDATLPIDHEIDPKEVRLDIHEDILPISHKSIEKEDALSDMDVEEGSLKKITMPKIKDKSASTPQFKKNVWPGQNSVKYFCSKKCKVVSGPDRWLFYVTILLVVVPALLFFVFPGSRIWYRWHHLGKALDIIGLYIFLSVFVFLFKSAYSDPGIIPRNPNWQQLFEENKWRYIAETYYQRRKRKKRKKKQISFKGISLNVNYCDTCHIFRPPRSSHCRICDCCIDSFDHHCPWTGNCVGKLNYRYFLLFIFSVLTACVYFTTLCLLQLFSRGRPQVFEEIEEDYFVDITVNQSPLANQLFLVTIMIIGFVLVGYLAFVHCKLLALGQTTYENLKGKWDGGLNPFDLGCKMNWLRACCGAYYSSYIDVSWMKKDNK